MAEQEEDESILLQEGEPAGAARNPASPTEQDARPAGLEERTDGAEPVTGTDGSGRDARTDGADRATGTDGSDRDAQMDGADRVTGTDKSGRDARADGAARATGTDGAGRGRSRGRGSTLGRGAGRGRSRTSQPRKDRANRAPSLPGPSRPAERGEKRSSKLLEALAAEPTRERKRTKQPGLGRSGGPSLGFESGGNPTMKSIRKLATRFKRGDKPQSSSNESETDATHTPTDVSEEPEEGTGRAVENYLQTQPPNPNISPEMQQRISADLKELARAREEILRMRRTVEQQAAEAGRRGDPFARTSSKKGDLYARASDCSKLRESNKSKKKKSRRSKKGKKKKKGKKNQSSSSSSSAVSNSDLSSGEVFRNAWGANSTSAVQLARRSPGTLSKVFIRTLRKLIRGRGHLSRGSSGDGDSYEAIVTTYVTTLLLPNSSIQKRNTRELLTLASVLDHLFLGEIPEACDVLCQRFKAVESAALDNSWVTAQHHELVPDLRISSVSKHEQEEAIRKEAKWNRVLGLTRG